MPLIGTNLKLFFKIKNIFRRARGHSNFTSKGVLHSVKSLELFLELQVFKTIMIQKILFFLSLVSCSWAIAVPDPNEFKIFSAVPHRTTSKLPPDYPTECPVVANGMNCEKSNVSIYLILPFFNFYLQISKMKEMHLWFNPFFRL